MVQSKKTGLSFYCCESMDIGCKALAVGNSKNASSPC